MYVDTIGDCGVCSVYPFVVGGVVRIRSVVCSGWWGMVSSFRGRNARMRGGMFENWVVSLGREESACGRDIVYTRQNGGCLFCAV